MFLVRKQGEIQSWWISICMFLSRRTKISIVVCQHFKMLFWLSFLFYCCWWFLFCVCLIALYSTLHTYRDRTLIIGYNLLAPNFSHVSTTITMFAQIPSNASTVLFTCTRPLTTPLFLTLNQYIHTFYIHILMFQT